MKYQTKRTASMYAAHAKKYKGHVFGVVLAIIIGDFFKTATPYIYKLLFDNLANQAPIDVLFGFIMLVASSALLHWGAIQAATFMYADFATRVSKDLAATCFKSLHGQGHTFFQNNFVGSLVKKANRFIDGFENIFGSILWDIFPILLNLIFIVIVLSSRYWQLGVLVLFWAILFCALNYVSSQFKLKYDIQRGELDSKVTGVFADTVTNHSAVKLFTGFAKEEKKFYSIITDLRKIRLFTWNLSNLFNTVQWFLIILLDASVMYFAVILWQRGILTIGDFLLIQAYLLTLFEKLWNFGRTIRDIYENIGNAEEMTLILDTKPDIQDAKEATALRVKKGSIIFDQVSFAYQQPTPIIDSLNLVITPGEKIAFVGASGAGKSTIIKLLLRIHDTTKGSISIDDQDIAKVTQLSLHSAMSYVPQEPVLFHRSLADNICYGKPQASKQDMIRAAKAAHCHEFISNLPEGYNTFVGERGVKLSGGERQRVAIARAMLRNAPILILDEATSSLDSLSESYIQEALEKLMKGKTVITIAHRLSTIMKMDRIIVLNNGKIIETGRHTELIKKKKGVYAELWKHQAGGYV